MALLFYFLVWSDRSLSIVLLAFWKLSNAYFILSELNYLLAIIQISKNCIIFTLNIEFSSASLIYWIFLLDTASLILPLKHSNCWIVFYVLAIAFWGRDYIVDFVNNLLTFFYFINLLNYLIAIILISSFFFKSTINSKQHKASSINLFSILIALAKLYLPLSKATITFINFYLIFPNSKDSLSMPFL